MKIALVLVVAGLVGAVVYVLTLRRAGPEDDSEPFGAIEASGPIGKGAAPATPSPILPSMSAPTWTTLPSAPAPPAPVVPRQPGQIAPSAAPSVLPGSPPPDEGDTFTYVRLEASRSTTWQTKLISIFGILVLTAFAGIAIATALWLLGHLANSEVARLVTPSGT